MSAILEALMAMDESLDRFEIAAEKVERKVKRAAARPQKPQRDLFSAVAPGRRNEDVIAIDPAVLARKLDLTIERVEKILREG